MMSIYKSLVSGILVTLYKSSVKEEDTIHDIQNMLLML